MTQINCNETFQYIVENEHLVTDQELREFKIICPDSFEQLPTHIQDRIKPKSNQPYIAPNSLQSSDTENDNEIPSYSISEELVKRNNQENNKSEHNPPPSPPKRKFG